MAATVTRVVPLSPEAAFAAVADVAAHGDHVPLTRVVPGEGLPGVGWSFVALTGAGRASFADPMTLTEWDPPRRLRLVKTGSLLGGWAQLDLEPVPGGTRVAWTEEIRPALLGRRARRLVDALTARMVAGVLDGLLPPGGQQ